MGRFFLTPSNRNDHRSYGSSATDNFNKNVAQKKQVMAKKMKLEKYAKTEGKSGFPKYVKVNHYKD